MKVVTLDRIEEFRWYFNLDREGVLLEPDLDVVNNDCDLSGRKRRDAEVLCTLAANVRGNCVDLGTSHGRSAFKLATNLEGRGRVFTVNILPEQVDADSGRLITHLPPREAIGSYFRERAIGNIEQIYADTSKWNVPPEIADLGLVFVDAAHDTDMVFNDSLKLFPRLAESGFICWHDFCPELRSKWEWIDAVMQGVERFMDVAEIDGDVVHLRHSWIGVLRKVTIHG